MVKIEVPLKIKKFILKNKILQKELEKRITPGVMDELLTEKRFKDLRIDKIRVVINGINTKKAKVFIKPIEISKDKPLTKNATFSNTGGYSIYYLIYKIK